MPKELFYDKDYDYEDQADYNVGVLGWSKDACYVQLGVVDASNMETHDPKDGRFIQLDRFRINQMIRTLRRARDQAYGKDE